MKGEKRRKGQGCKKEGRREKGREETGRNPRRTRRQLPDPIIYLNVHDRLGEEDDDVHVHEGKLRVEVREDGADGPSRYENLRPGDEIYLSGL